MSYDKTFRKKQTMTHLFCILWIWQIWQVNNFTSNSIVDIKTPKKNWKHDTRHKRGHKSKRHCHRSHCRACRACKLLLPLSKKTFTENDSTWSKLWEINELTIWLWLVFINLQGWNRRMKEILNFFLKKNSTTLKELIEE